MTTGKYKKRFNGILFEEAGWCTSFARKESIKENYRMEGRKCRVTSRRTIDGTGTVYQIWVEVD